MKADNADRYFSSAKSAFICGHLRDKNNYMKDILKYSIGLGLGIFLFYLAFRDISIDKVKGYFATAKWGWLIFSMCFAIVSHFVRALRWRMQLKASGYQVSVPTAFSAVMMTYMVNLALPRAGEVVRCTMLYQSDKVPVPVSIGTVFTERVLDVLILAVLLLVSLGLANEQILGFWAEITRSKTGGISPLIYIGSTVFMLLIVGLFLFRKKIIALPITQKIMTFVKELLTAAWSIQKLENPLLFVFYSILIWVCYIMMMYVGLYCFEPIASVSGEVNLLKFAFLGTVIGSLGMAIPIPGGIGPYHNAIIFSFIAFHIFPAEDMSRIMGQTFAFAFHTAQMLVMLMGGLGGYAYLMLKKKE